MHHRQQCQCSFARFMSFPCCRKRRVHSSGYRILWLYVLLGEWAKQGSFCVLFVLFVWLFLLVLSSSWSVPLSNKPKQYIYTYISSFSFFTTATALHPQTATYNHGGVQGTSLQGTGGGCYSKNYRKLYFRTSTSSFPSCNGGDGSGQSVWWAGGSKTTWASGLTSHNTDKPQPRPQ